MLKESLLEYGLKPKQIKIYLALLVSSKLSAQELAEATGLIRQVVYDNIAQLIEIGLVSVFVEGRTKKYEANDPKTLLSALAQKKEQIKAILPELEKLREHTSTKSIVVSAKGLKGIKNLLYSTLEEKTPLFCIVNYKKSHDIFQEHLFFNYAIKRVEKKIPLNIIIEPTKISSKEELNIWNTSKKSFRKTKVHKAVKNFPSMYFLTNNKVIMLNMDKGEIRGVLIEDRIAFQSQKILFDFLWESAKPF